jgi:hypothetical protein
MPFGTLQDLIAVDEIKTEGYTCRRSAASEDAELYALLMS